MSLPLQASAEYAAPAMAGSFAGEADALANAGRGNEVHRQREQLLSEFAPAAGATPAQPPTPASACLEPILLALDWAGEERHFNEALPHLDEIRDIDSLRAVLARLKFPTTKVTTALSRITADRLPCLFVRPNGGICVIIALDEPGKVLAFDGDANGFRLLDVDATPGAAYFTERRRSEGGESRRQRSSWLNESLRRFRPAFGSLILASLLSNILALMVPLFVMAAYDRVVPTGSVMTLAFLAAGIAIVLGGDFAMRKTRAVALAFFGARLEALISISAIERLFFMPVQMTEAAPVASQITRIRQFEVMRDLFIGPIATAVFDAPFLVLALATITVLGGSIAWVPIALIAGLVLLGAATSPTARRLQREAGEERSRNRRALGEIVVRCRSIRELGAEADWIERYRDCAATAAVAQFRAQQFNSTVQTIAQSLVMVAGVATLGIGATQALDGAVSVGALIAIVALVWRTMSPIQAAFVGFGKINQAIETSRQIDQLMRLALEREPGELPTLFRSPVGRISLARVMFRHSPFAEAALAGVSLDIAPGEMIAITGENGSGKSTLLHLILGLYQPQAGGVLIDGLDVRQLNPGELRHSIGYVPTGSEFFYGTIAQNLRFAHPEASDQDIERVLKALGAWEAVRSMPNGVDTRLGSNEYDALPASLRQQLALARAFVKDAPIYLLDEPAGGLSWEADQAFVALLERLKGRSTIVMVTHRPSHMRLADRVVVLNRGTVVADRPPGPAKP